MTKKPTPQWQPITYLSLLAQHIDGMLEPAQEQYTNLQEARPKPWILDDYTVQRVIEVFTVQRDDLWLFEEQLQRWSGLSLTTRQRTEVTRLGEQMAKLRQTVADGEAAPDCRRYSRSGRRTEKRND